MRWFLSLVVTLFAASITLAAGPDDIYLDVYNEVLTADSLQQSGHTAAAAIKYADAQTRLQQFKAANPAWNPPVIAFRLQYLSEKIQALGPVASPTNGAPVTATATATPAAPSAPSHPDPVLEQQIASLQDQVRALNAANGELENKLKEALSVQPAAVSPVELAKREDEILALKKEKDLLTVALDQAKSEKAAASAASTSSVKLASDLAAAQREAGEANKKLEAEDRQLAELKASAANQVSAADAARLTQERDQLKAELTVAQQQAGAANKKLEEEQSEVDSLKAAAANQSTPAEAARLTEERDKLKAEVAQRTKELADAEAHGDADVLSAHAQLKEALAQRDELQKKLDAANAAPAAAADTTELERLRARLAVLEAKTVPYTAEELALLHVAPSQSPAPPAAPANRPHVAHSSMDLPPGAGALMRDATRASMERDFAGAEEKYKEILRQDENNVFVLAFLADAQFAEGHLDDCEKTVDKAVGLDPDYPASLYVLGLLRYRQEKLDDALDALSRSAKLNPTNASTQNFLGCVLADKGLRPQAETAFRKALQIEPDYRDAHYNIAFIYATEKPGSPELARWHYKRAVDLGHPKNTSLEAILAGDKQDKQP